MNRTFTNKQITIPYNTNMTYQQARIHLFKYYKKGKITLDDVSSIYSDMFDFNKNTVFNDKAWDLAFRHC